MKAMVMIATCVTIFASWSGVAWGQWGRQDAKEVLLVIMSHR